MFNKILMIKDVYKNLKANFELLRSSYLKFETPTA